MPRIIDVPEQFIIVGENIHATRSLLRNGNRAKTLDDGTEYFQPSNLEITSIDVGNHTTNVVPAKASAQFNIRFNNEQTSESLVNWLGLRSKKHKKVFSKIKSIRVAVNHEVTSINCKIKQNDEIAFFPPFTGG